MEIHFIRNATLIIHAANQHILVDPMLGDKGSLPRILFFDTRPTVIQRCRCRPK